MNRIILATLIAVLSCGYFHQAFAQKTQTTKTKAAPKPRIADIAYRIVGVKDGDTYVLLVAGKELVVRLTHVDCPEKNQPFGSAAKKAASDLCFGKMVLLKHDNKYDRNGRLLAEIILPDGRNLNKLLVERGLAWHFKKYSKDQSYARLEEVARSKKVGLWSQAATAPWEWRKSKKSPSKQRANKTTKPAR